MTLTETLANLTHQMQTGPVSVSACAHRCDEIAIGGMVCEKCLTGHLIVLVGKPNADRFKAAIVAYHAGGGKANPQAARGFQADKDNILLEIAAVQAGERGAAA